MIPSMSRVATTLGGATIGIVLAALGIAGNLGAFFGLIGASFGPICGAIVADYLLSGRKWVGPRAGVSVAGYAAWVIGFAVGISNNPLVSQLVGKELLASWQPASVYSFIVGFVVYAILAKIGLQGKAVSMDLASTGGFPVETAQK
jgi:cytosine permease